MDKDTLIDMIKEYAYWHHLMIQAKAAGTPNALQLQQKANKQLENILDYGDLLTRLYESTKALHERFGDDWTLQHGLRKFAEESLEFTLEAYNEASGKSFDSGHVYQEMVDVIVTMFSCLIRLGLDVDRLPEYIEHVITKNDAKTLDTHQRVNGMIVRK